MNWIAASIDIGLTYRGSDWFKATLAGEINPVYYVIMARTAKHYPLVSDPYITLKLKEKYISTPSFNISLSGTISLPNIKTTGKGHNLSPSDWKLWFSTAYIYTRYEHTVIDFYYTGALPSITFHWNTKKVIQVDHEAKLEGALLIPVGALYLQLGGGVMLNRTYYDSREIIKDHNYFINITGKTLKY